MLGVSSRLIAASVLGIALTAPAVMAAPLLYDDFTGNASTAPDSTLWSTYHYSGAGTNLLDGNSHLVSNVNTNAYGNYVGTVSKSSSFDAFGSSPLKIDLSGLAVGGAPPASGTASNNGFILYGRSNNNTVSEYHTDGTAMAFGIGALLGSSHAGYTLSTTEYSDNASNGVVFKHAYALAGAPTGLSLVIDGSGRTLDVTLVGTTFTATGLTTLSETLSSDFTKANLSSGGVLTSRIAVGAVNGAAPANATTFSIDSITASVPEPACLGLAACGALLLFRRRRS